LNELKGCEKNHKHLSKLTMVLVLVDFTSEHIQQISILLYRNWISLLNQTLESQSSYLIETISSTPVNITGQ